MRKIYVSFACLLTFMFAACKKDLSVSSVSTLDVNTDTVTHITILGNKFINSKTGAEFKMWGFNYAGGQTESLLDDSWNRSAVMSAVGNDCRYMSDSLGANVVRIILQFNRFMISTTQPNTANIGLLKRGLDTAKKYNIHVVVTGLGANRPSDQPAWYTNLSDADRWAAQANFWKAIATALAITILYLVMTL